MVSIKKCIFALLLITGVLAAHADNCFAQQSKNLIFQYDDFSGGLNTKLSPYALSKSEATITENIRFDTRYKAITKRDPTKTSCTADATGPITGLHRFYMKDGTKTTLAMYGNKIVTCDDTTGLPTTILTVNTSDNRWDCLTWHDIAICTDGANQPVKYDGTSASATYLGTALALDAGSGAGPNGTYTYKVSCYTASYEISLGVESNSITVSDNDINLSMIPTCPDTILGESVTGRKIYRTTSNGSTFKLLSNGTIADNTSVTLTDSDADGALGSTLSPTATYTIPLGKYILVHKNKLWLANNSSNPSTIYYSEDASQDYFDTSALFNIRPNDGDEITFIKNWLGILTVSKNNTIQKIDTFKDDPDTDWEITDPFSFVGCQAPYSAVNTDTGIMYLGNNGIYVFSGQYSELISDKISPVIKDIQASNYPNVWAEYFKNSYYMAYTSIETGSSINDRILVVDMIDKAFSIDIFSANVLHVYNSGTDVEALFSGASDSGIIYAHTDTVKEIKHKAHSDFTGTFDDMRYIPTAVGGDAESPVFEIAWTATIDSVSDGDWTGTIDSVVRPGYSDPIIDRPDFDGSYTSQVLTVNASSLDKLYWKETLPTNGGDVTFDVRSGSTAAGILSAPWTTGFTDSTGSDISTVTADSVLQYKVNMTTDTITETPTLFRESDYVVRLTFNVSGAAEEGAIQFHYQTGWLDYGLPGYVKELRKVYVYYDWEDDTAGTLNITFRTIGNGQPSEVSSTQTEEKSFAINLGDYPDYYVEYFPQGNLIGELIQMEIEEESTNPIKIEKIIVVYDIQADLT